MRMFCTMVSYNCSLIDSRCTQCSSHSICTECSPNYYANRYPNTTSNCLACASVLAGC
jgi:hypothetical protein